METKRKSFISSGLEGIISHSSSVSMPPQNPKPNNLPPVKKKHPVKKTPRQLKAQDTLNNAYQQEMSTCLHANYQIGVGQLKIAHNLITPKNKSTRTKPFLINLYQRNYHLVFVYDSNAKYVYKINDLMYQDFLYQLYKELLVRGFVFRDRKYTPQELIQLSTSINTWINAGIAEGKYYLVEKTEAHLKNQRTMNLIKNLDQKPHLIHKSLNNQTTATLKSN